MPFAIVAEFPLGTYRGHRPDTSLDVVPSPARLHAALLAAAGQGTRAIAQGDGLAPTSSDRAALEWLESNPPDALTCPPIRRHTDLAIAYRAEGFFGVRDRRPVLVTREDVSGSVALGGPLAWLWDAAPPSDIGEALAGLCRDVPYLGVTESPVILRVGDAEPTHRLDPQASLLSGEGLDLEVPRPGRTAALMQAFDAFRGRTPAPDTDRQKSGEGAISPPNVRTELAFARYVPLGWGPTTAPWPTIVVLPVDRFVPPDQRVAWCVALHRALVARIGDGAPAVVTGHYEPGVRRPANRLAIQYLPQAVSGAPDLGAPGAFLLLLPGDADPADLAALDRAVRSLGEIRWGRSRAVHVRGVEVLDGDRFWAPVPGGSVRTWVTATPAIPESRPVRGRSWTIGEAALLSLGLVFRDRFARATEARPAWYASLVEAVADQGATVIEAHKLNGPDVSRWVHRTNGETAVQPYGVALRLGAMAGERTILAIGQSRHLGGGLLTPIDLPDTDGQPPARSER